MPSPAEKDCDSSAGLCYLLSVLKSHAEEWKIMAFRLLQTLRMSPRLDQFVRTASDANPVPFWVPGSGQYCSTLRRLTKTIADCSIPLILPRLDSVPVPSKSGVFTIGNYGTFDGEASLNVVRLIIEHLRARQGEGLSVQVLYEDQELNDYNSLFRTLHGESSYLRDLTNVFPLVTNTNFYKQVVPDEFCDVIFSSAAVHWLTDSAPRMEDTLFALTSSEEELRAMQDFAARCWQDWLLLRARELKPGGLLVVTSLAASDSYLDFPKRPTTRSELTPDTSTAHLLGILLDYQDSWRELRDTAVISEAEFKAASFRFAIRAPREITQPFDEVPSPVRQAGLEKVWVDQTLIPCPFKAQWREKLEKEGIHDRQLFAEKLTEAYKVWSYSTFCASLDDSRAENEKNAILNQLYDVIKRRTAESDPETYRSDSFVLRFIAQKRI